MKLALRTQYAADASWLDRRANDVIRARLVTRYPHAGIVIGDTLYHSTAKRGVHSLKDWTPERWDLVECGGNDQKALDVFDSLDGGRYDWFSLLAFVGIKARDSKASYCFELCHHMLTGKHPTERVTPENLLRLAIDMRGN